MLEVGRGTYDAESADDFLGRRLHVHYDVVDEVGGDADDDHHGNDLYRADHEEGRGEGSGAVAWDLHCCGLV